MKIGYYSDNFLPMVNSGVVVSLCRFGKELVKRGHEVDLYCPTSDRKSYFGMKVHSCSAVPFKPYPQLRVGWPINMNPPDFDFIHSHSPFTLGWYGIKTGIKQGIPKVVTYHTVFEENITCMTKFGQNTIRKISDSYMDFHHSFYEYIIAPSEYIKEIVKHLEIPTTVIPTGVDLKELKYTEGAKEKLGVENKKVYLVLSRIAAEKNIDIVIKAANKFLDDNSVLFIVGCGPAEKGLKKIAKHKNIIFTGFVPDEMLQIYYSAADFFITASKSETQGLTTLEAMACGTPVIAANAMANPEFVDDEVNGYLFEPDNIEQLVYLAKEKKIPEDEMQKQALRTAKKYSIEKCTDKLVKFYKKII